MQPNPIIQSHCYKPIFPVPTMKHCRQLIRERIFTRLFYGLRNIQSFYPFALYMYPRQPHHIRITIGAAVLLAPAAFISISLQSMCQF